MSAKLFLGNLGFSTLESWLPKAPLLKLFPLVFLVSVLSFTISPRQVYGAWFNASWNYRVPINIPATATVNSTIKVDVDFAALISTLGISGTFDGNSPRIVRPNDALSTFQQFTDSVYAGSTDAVNNSRGEIRFILEDAGPATYYLYFDVTTSGVKAANPQTPINGNFEFGTVAGASPQVPPGWLTATRSNNTMDSQIRQSETITVTDQTTATTNGNPLTGLASYLQGYRSSADSGGNAVLTKTITIPATTPGTISIRYRPEGWDSGQNGNTTQYDYLQVRLLNGATTVLDIIGPTLNNYVTCPFSPNYRAAAITTTQPGYGRYNHWDNGANSNNHTLGLSALYNRGLEPWVTCTVNLTTVAGLTLTLEIRSNYVNQYRSWFLLDDIEWSVVIASLGTPTGNVIDMVPANFNCVETGADALSGHLYTKLAGTAFNVDVVALKSDGSVETNYAVSASKSVTLEFVDGSGTTACASRTSLSPVIPPLSFLATDQGRKTSANITLGKAYPNLSCRVTDRNQTPNVVGCSADNFSVRPTDFTITSADANADVFGSNSSAAPVIRTGANFSLTAASGVEGYNSTPLIDTSKLSAHSGAIQTGTLSGSFAAADSTSGTAEGTAFTYSEVGYFNFGINGIYDNTFTTVDSAVGDCTADYSPTLTGGQYGCYFGNTAATVYFGRFIPDHFAITPGMATPACSPSFTYFGEDGFSSLFTLTAQNSSNSTTQNYHGGFARLGLTTWTGFNFSAASLPAGSVLSASATAPVGTWRHGVADVVAKHQASKPTALTGETSVVVNAAPVDLDNVTMTATAVAPATPLRYGRLVLQNAFGSELLALPVSLTAQYWNGSAFVLNTNDSCTAVSAPTSGSGLTFYPEVTAGAVGNHLSDTETTATISATNKLVGGDGLLSFSAPGSGNDGYFDISISAPSWLKFDWDTTNAGEEFPTGRVTFGIYKGDNSQIYWREVY